MAQTELLYGRHAVLEALRAGRRRVQRIFLGQGVRAAPIVADVLAAAKLRGCPIIEAQRQMLDQVGPVNHQGIVAETAAYPYVDLDELLAVPKPAGWAPMPATGGAGAAAAAAVLIQAADPLYLILDHLQDVQNLGTLLRTAEAMAVTGVLVPDRRAAGITPAVVNASAGAVEHLRIALVGSLAQTMARLKTANVWVVGLDAGPGAIPLGKADLTGPLALVVGAEGAGLARLVREQCDWLLAIPMYGVVASLNAAVAGSVALVAARQARREGPDI